MRHVARVRRHTARHALAVLVDAVRALRELAVELLQFAQEQVRGFALQVREDVVLGELGELAC